jgi:hypothetical protein
VQGTRLAGAIARINTSFQQGLVTPFNGCGREASKS